MRQLPAPASCLLDRVAVSITTVCQTRGASLQLRWSRRFPVVIFNAQNICRTRSLTTQVKMLVACVHVLLEVLIRYVGVTSTLAQAPGLGGRDGAVPGRSVHRRGRVADPPVGRAGGGAVGHLQHLHRCAS